jgi:pimeloyl-ACP methyl ester carboxylesterase
MRKPLFLFALIAFAGCVKLDDNLYNKDNTIQSYQRDEYTGETDFILDSSYTIPASLIHEFTLQSQTSAESKATTIYATYIGDLSTISADTVIMYCHGNKWHMDFYWQRAKLLANVGGKSRFGVLMIDYRGYGLSEGDPTEEGMYADVDAALAWLRQNGLTGNRLIMYGFSLGTAPATELTANPRSLVPAKLMLEAPFASAEVMVQDASGLSMPGSFFTSLKIDNAEEIKKVNQPFFWIHGVNDDFLSIKTHGEVVYKNYHGQRSEAHRIEGGNHGTIQITMGIDNYKKTVLDFILSH